LGYFIGFDWGFYGHILYTIEDLISSLTTMPYRRTTPGYRIAYLWGIADGHSLEIAYDRSDTQQTGSGEYSLVHDTVGMLYRWSVDNPILSEFTLGANMQTVNYSDPADPNNDYRSTFMTANGALVF
jgi:hypothetical protein